MQVKKEQLKPDMEQQTGSKLWKEHPKTVFCHPAYLTCMQSIGLDEAQVGIKIAGRNINNLRYADTTTLMAEKQRRTEESLDESQRGQWKSWLKTQHSKSTKITASDPITSWQVDGEAMETVTDSIFLGSKITVNGDWSHEIKRHLLLEKKKL